MLSKRIGELPTEGTWIFEPKWDGFRALVFRDADEILIQSRDGKSLNRYFPELIDPLRAQLPTRCVVDGELVIAKGGVLDFEALQLRIHPAASRVKLLSQESPASVVFFDLLCKGDQDLRSQPFDERRKALESILSSAAPPIHVTPATQETSVAADWFKRFEGAGLDGVMAKPTTGIYESDKRLMFKVKHERDCDCVVAGFRWHKKGERTLVGSLLLGLFDDSGVLQHVGVCASFSMEKRRQLVEYLTPYRKNALADHPWGRWSEQEPRKQDVGCRAARVAGVKARIFLGNHCVQSSSSKWRMSTCKVRVSVIWPSFDGGARTRVRATALMPNSK